LIVARFERLPLATAQQSAHVLDCHASGTYTRLYREFDINLGFPHLLQ
jgi:hypothetical protein